MVAAGLIDRSRDIGVVPPERIREWLAVERRDIDIVDISVDESLPRGVSCKMTMTMNNGEQYVSQIDYPKGSIQNPMSDDELRTKFNTLAIPVIGDSHAAQLADLVAEVEQVTEIEIGRAHV